jgi:hypothetical protein
MGGGRDQGQGEEKDGHAPSMVARQDRQGSAQKILEKDG